MREDQERLQQISAVFSNISTQNIQKCSSNFREIQVLDSKINFFNFLPNNSHFSSPER
jgi:hypothetical protein